MHDLEKKAYLKKLEDLEKKMASMIMEDDDGMEGEGECPEDESEVMAFKEKNGPLAVEGDSGPGMEEMASEDSEGEMSPDEIKEYLKPKPKLKNKKSLRVAISMKPGRMG